MKKVEKNQLEKIVGGGWYEIMSCVMDMEAAGATNIYTSLQLCALAEEYPVTN